MGKIYICVGKKTKFIKKNCVRTPVSKKKSFKTENTIGKLLKVNKNINKKLIKCGT